MHAAYLAQKKASRDRLLPEQKQQKEAAKRARDSRFREVKIRRTKIGADLDPMLLSAEEEARKLNLLVDRYYAGESTTQIGKSIGRTSGVVWMMLNGCKVRFRQRAEAVSMAMVGWHAKRNSGKLSAFDIALFGVDRSAISTTNTSTGALFIGCLIPPPTVGQRVRLKGSERILTATHVMGSPKKGYNLCFKGQGPMPVGPVVVELLDPAPEP